MDYNIKNNSYGKMYDAPVRKYQDMYICLQLCMTKCTGEIANWKYTKITYGKN